MNVNKPITHSTKVNEDDLLFFFTEVDFTFKKMIGIPLFSYSVDLTGFFIFAYNHQTYVTINRKDYSHWIILPVHINRADELLRIHRNVAERA